MSVKKGFLVVLAVFAVALIIVGGRAKAHGSELTAASMITEPYLSGEIVISALDNEQYLPAIAYNSLHDEYLVV